MESDQLVCWLWLMEFDRLVCLLNIPFIAFALLSACWSWMILVCPFIYRYVVRAKAGKRQSGKDATGKVAHSAGSSLRRYNEAALKKVCYTFQSKNSFWCLLTFSSWLEFSFQIGSFFRCVSCLVTIAGSSRINSFMEAIFRHLCLCLYLCSIKESPNALWWR